MAIENPGRRGFLKNSVAAVGAAALPWLSPALARAGASPLENEQAAAGPTASPNLIKLDFDRQIGEIDRNIYGSFIEQLGSCVYGGVYEPGSPLSDSFGYRKDVLEAVRRLHIPLLRWPGGNFASGYNWKDGIGPRDKRPRRWDTAWEAAEPNLFGTDEFLRYCRMIGAEPYITVNMGTGTMQEAADWVEYCNATTDTSWANERRKNGHPEPYNVKFWGLGNEVYGDWEAGYKDARHYAADALEFAKMMRWVDSSIKLIAVSDGDDPVHWDVTVLEQLKDFADYLSVHHYGGSFDTVKEMQDAQHMERQIQVLDALITAVTARSRRKQRIAIAVDEWNIWFRSPSERTDPHKLEEVYNLRDALWVASAFNIFHRMCRTVRMANLAQLVNMIAPILTNKNGLVLQTTYFPFQLYAEHCGNVALDALVRSEPFPKTAGVPYIDVSATTDSNRSKLTLTIVNRHPTADIPVSIEIEGFHPRAEGVVYVVNGPNLDSTNTFDTPHNVKTTPSPLTGAAKKFQHTCPAHSLHMIVLEHA
jgi:alpha-N-arabinofuranosidase